MTPKNKFALTIVGASLFSTFIGAAAGYYFSATKVAVSAATLTVGTMTFGYVFRERKEIELLSQILSYKDQERTVEKRKALCSLLNIKMGVVSDLQKQYNDLYNSQPELKKSLGTMSESISSDIEISRQAVLRSSCAQT